MLGLHFSLMSGKRSRFTCARDAKIIELVEQGKSWETIGRIMGADPKTCQSRYEDYLAPGGKKNIWTHHDDEQLRQVVKEMQQNGQMKSENCWTMVKFKLHWDRSVLMIKKRYEELVEGEVEEEEEMIEEEESEAELGERKNPIEQIQVWIEVVRKALENISIQLGKLNN